jgi:hypothetical protein
MGSVEITRARERIKTVQDFMKEVERFGGKIPPGLKRSVDRYIFAAEMGLDAAEAADEVSAELRLIYEDAYRICGDANGGDGTDDYWICRARVDRQWQARNVQKTLDWNDDRSWVMKVWGKWKARLANWLVDEAKGKAKDAVKSASE